MKKISSRVIILILVVAFIPSPGLAVEPITTSGVILGAKIVGWAATGISAAKTTAEIAYQQYVSRESIQLYEQQLEHIDDELLTTRYKIDAREEEQEKFLKLLSKEKALLHEKQSLSAVLLAIKENRDVVIKKKAIKEIKKVATGYVTGELVPITAGGALTKTGKDLLGAVYNLQGTISGIPPDAKDAWLKSDVSTEDKQFYSIIAAEKVPRKIDVAVSKAEFDKYINEIAKPKFKDFLENKNDDFTKLPPAIKKMLWGELEAKKAERAKQREELEQEYRKMREEYFKNKEKMAQTRLEVLENVPEVTEGFEQIAAQESQGDVEKLAQNIASQAITAGKILTGEVEIPQEQEAEKEVAEGLEKGEEIVIPGYQEPFTEEEIKSIIENCIKTTEEKLDMQLSSLTRQYIAGYVTWVVNLYREYDIYRYNMSLPPDKRFAEEFREPYRKRYKELQEISKRQGEDNYKIIERVYDQRRRQPVAKSSKIKFSSCADWLAYQRKYLDEYNKTEDYFRELRKSKKKGGDPSDQWQREVSEKGDTPRGRQLFIEAINIYVYELALREKQYFKNAEYKFLEPLGENLCQKGAASKKQRPAIKYDPRLHDRPE